MPKQNEEQRQHYFADYYLKIIYDSAQQAMRSSYSTSTAIPMPALQKLFQAYERINVGLVIREIEERSGIRVIPSPKKGVPPYVCFSSNTIQPCEVTIGQETMMLDFPALVEEHHSRREYHSHQMAIVAVQFIKQCVACLDNIALKCYGLPEQVNLILNDHNHAFPDTFELDGETFFYQALNEAQRLELIDIVNQRIAFGEVEMIINNSIRVYLKKMPYKFVEQPQFDYRDFYEQYDEVSPELRGIIGEICANLKPVTAEQQIARLTPRRALIYHFTKDSPLNFTDVKNGFEKGKHLADLEKEVVKTYRGIKITNTTFRSITDDKSTVNTGGLLAQQDCIEFSYDILTLFSDLARKQSNAELTIRSVYAHNDTEIARILAERLLHHIKSCGIQSYLEPDLIWSIPSDYLLVDVNFNRELVQIDLSQVANEALDHNDKAETFLDTISHRIGKLTDGLLKVDLFNQQFQVVL